MNAILDWGRVVLVKLKTRLVLVPLVCAVDIHSLLLNFSMDDLELISIHLLGLYHWRLLNYYHLGRHSHRHWSWCLFFSEADLSTEVSHDEEEKSEADQHGEENCKDDDSPSYFNSLPLHVDDFGS